MSKLFQFLNKYLFLFLVLAYLLNKYANPDLELQTTILVILVVIMFINLFIKFYFLYKQDKTDGTNRLRAGLILLAVALVFMLIYVYVLKFLN